MNIFLHDRPATLLHPADDVAIALVPLHAGRHVAVEGREATLTADVGAGHKLALRAVEPGQPVRRYGQVIGFATRPIAPGDHVHSHNLAVGDPERRERLRRVEDPAETGCGLEHGHLAHSAATAVPGRHVHAG